VKVKTNFKKFKMEELPMLLTIIAEMLTDEGVEIQVGIEELAAMLPQRELFLERNRGPTDFVGIIEYVQYTVNRYTARLFKQHFRMSRLAFQVLLCWCVFLVPN
jgi:hypothetical protein